MAAATDDVFEEHDFESIGNPIHDTYKCRSRV